MAVSTTSGIDDLHLRALDTQIEGNVGAPVETGATVATQQTAASDASAGLDGEAVLAMDVWQGTGSGPRKLGAGNTRAPAVAGMPPRAGIDASAAHVLAALG